MPHQQNPDRGPGGANPTGQERNRTHGHRTATPDAPRLPHQRHETPSRPPANATPPSGRPATAPRPTPPGGAPTVGRPPSNPGQRPTRMMPGPGTPETANARSAGPPRPPGDPSGSGGSGSGGDASVPATAKQAKSTSDLQFNKIVAGAGAAVVTAVLGSFLGAVGTILGAALGSIITTLATTFFQRSIDVTRAQVTDTGQKLKQRRGSPGARGAAAWQAAAADGGTGVAGPGSQETVRIDPTAAGATAAPASSGSRWRLRKMSRKQVVFGAIGAVLAFALAMFLVTGVEWVKGSTLTGNDSGTTIGNVANGGAAPQPNKDDTSGSSPSTSETSSPSTSESNSNESGQPTGTSQNDDDSGSSSSTSESNPLGGLNNIVPTQENETGQQQSGSSNNSGGGANSSN